MLNYVYTVHLIQVSFIYYYYVFNIDILYFRAMHFATDEMACRRIFLDSDKL